MKEFHNRQLSDKYVVIFMDATYLNVRRDSVAKEPLNVLPGITPDGPREVLDYALYPTESAANYEEMMQGIKSRGVKQVLLFASDGLEGMRDAVKRQFPDADYQQCWVHLNRTVCRYIRNKDRKEVLGDLKSVYRANSEEKAREVLQEFDAWLRTYSRALYRYCPEKHMTRILRDCGKISIRGVPGYAGIKNRLRF